jgi:hypothetical protein
MSTIKNENVTVDDTTGPAPDRTIVLPWTINPALSWLYYTCFIECHLDSGIVTHRILPQSNQPYDSLGSGDVYDPTLQSATNGVNLKSNGNFTDFVQRMANSIYRFRLMGTARRIGYLIPIPQIISIAGVAAIPDDEVPQKAKNVLISNNYGIPVYMATWDLWYTVASTPRGVEVPPANLAEQIDNIAPNNLPTGIKVPISGTDDRSFLRVGL